METQNTAASAAQQTVIRNGSVVPALTEERVLNILNGMKSIDIAQSGMLLKGLKVTGNGTYRPAELTKNGKIAPASFIYNVNMKSEVAVNGPKAQLAIEKFSQATAAGDIEKMHDAGRELLNALTVSFNTNAVDPNNPPFYKGQLVQGQVQLVETENGKLLKLINVSAMPAVDVQSLGSKKVLSLATLRTAPITATAGDGGTSDISDAFASAKTK